MKASEERGFSVSGRRSLDHPAPARLAGGDVALPPAAPEDAAPVLLEAFGDFMRRGLDCLAGGSRRGVALRLAVLNHLLFPIDQTDAALATRLRISRAAVSKVRLALERALPELRRRRQ